MIAAQSNPETDSARDGSATSSASAAPTSSTALEAPEAACQVLVVEDDPAQRLLAEVVLEEAGYAVRTAGDGLEALRAVAQDTPDVIVLDAHLPVMDAAAFAHSYHAQPPAHAPIVLVSADIMVDGMAADVGAAAVLEKPFPLGALVETVEHVLTPPITTPDSP